MQRLKAHAYVIEAPSSARATAMPQKGRGVSNRAHASKRAILSSPGCDDGAAAAAFCGEGAPPPRAQISKKPSRGASRECCVQLCVGTLGAAVCFTATR